MESRTSLLRPSVLKVASLSFLLLLPQVIQARRWRRQRRALAGRAGAAQGADGGLGHHGDLRGLQEVHHGDHLIQQEQPEHGQQAGAAQPQDAVLLHVLVQLRQLPALRAHHQRGVASYMMG